MTRRPSAAPSALVLSALSVLSVLSALGCESSGESVTRATSASSLDTSPTSAEPERSPVAPASEETRARVEKLRTSLDEAVSDIFAKMVAAAEAGMEVERGETPCERAFTGFSGMIAYLKATTPEREAELSLPDRAEFFAACEALGPEMQRCLQLGYAMQNQEECQRVHAALTPEEIERLDAVKVREGP